MTLISGNAEQTEYKYSGRTENLQRRLRQHKCGRCHHDLNTENKGSEMRIKHVLEKQHWLKEGRFIRCFEQKVGRRLPVNKRKGDGVNQRQVN